MDNFILATIESLTLVEQGRSIRSILQKVISKYNLSADDGSTVYYLVFEIFRRLNYLDMCIKLSTSAFSLKKLDPRVKSLLRLVTHWLKINQKNPNEILSLIGNLDFVPEDLALDDIINKIAAITTDQLNINRNDSASILSIQYYLPTWIVRRFIEQWGNEFSLKVIESFSTMLPTYVRVNTHRSTDEAIIKLFEENNIEFVKDLHVPHLFKIIHADVPIPKLPEFNKGHIVIQQKASALAPLVLDPQKGEKILDMCASPGSKTSQIANIMGGGKGIVAVDISDSRIQILKNRLQLLGITGIKVVKADARLLGKKYQNHFDRILLDPPCTGSGTYSSRPEIKWRLKKRALKVYVKLQNELLESAGSLVKNGGTIVYSTCSLFREENHDVIENFLNKHPNFTLEKIDLDIGVKSEQFGYKTVEIYPHLHETEGFFIAKLKKINT